MENKITKERMENYKLNKQGCKVDKGKTANTRHLIRIIIYLSCVNYANITKIKEEVGIVSPYLKDAINFLVNHKIIFNFSAQVGKMSRITQYALNPLFKK